MSKSEIRRVTLQAIATAIRVVPDHLEKLAARDESDDDESILFQSALLLKGQAELLRTMSQGRTVVAYGPPPRPIAVEPGEVHFDAELKAGEERDVDAEFHHRIKHQNGDTEIFKTPMCQRPFRGERFTGLAGVVVTSIRIGVEEQLVMEAPGEALEQGPRLALHTCLPGLLVKIRVRNQSSKPLELHATLHGAFL